MTVDAYLGAADDLQRLLEPGEQARAQKFRTRKLRSRWVVVRGLLRLVLGRYLGSDPSHLRFDYGPHGKPALGAGFRDQGIRFNLAHSGSLVLYAIARVPVGVDVERLREDFDTLAVARHCFSGREYQAILALPAELMTLAFYAAWTRKEAYLKGRGCGISRGVHQVEVSVDPRAPPLLIRTLDEEGHSRPWTLTDLASKPGYRAALATEGWVKVHLLEDPVLMDAFPDILARGSNAAPEAASTDPVPPQ